MPSLGADMDKGRLIEWKVKPGDHVKRGQIVAIVETPKAAVDVEIFEDGIVERLLVDPQTEMAVGAPMALLRATNETAVTAIPQVAEHPHLSHRARKLAHQAASETTLRVSDNREAMRAVIAAAMSRSKREIPHYYLGNEVDLKPSLDWLSEENAKRPMEDRIIYAVLLLKAVAKAVASVPEVNGFWLDGRFQASQAVNVGVAISLRQGGLVAPAIHDVDKKDLGLLMRELNDLVLRARSGSLRSSEFSDATITVTNLGEQGVDSVFGVIYPPQVAIVGFGKISARQTVQTTLAGDHRASDGHRGGLFLVKIAQLLQHPENL